MTAKEWELQNPSKYKCGDKVTVLLDGLSECTGVFEYPRTAKILDTDIVETEVDNKTVFYREYKVLITQEHTAETSQIVNVHYSAVEDWDPRNELY